MNLSPFMDIALPYDWVLARALKGKLRDETLAAGSRARPLLQVAGKSKRRLSGDRLSQGNLHFWRTRRGTACKGGDPRRAVFRARADWRGYRHRRIVHGRRLDDARLGVAGSPMPISAPVSAR